MTTLAVDSPAESSLDLERAVHVVSSVGTLSKLHMPLS